MDFNLATILRKGLMPKLSGSASDVLRGDGTYGTASVNGSAQGRVAFAGASPFTLTDSANIVWNEAGKRLVIGGDGGSILYVATGVIRVSSADGASSICNFAVSTSTGGIQQGFDAQSGRINFAAASASAPTYAFFGSDSNTGIWSPASGHIAISLAGADVVLFKSRHILHKGTGPTLTSGGGGTASAITGKDEAFTVSIGTSVGTATFTVTFATAFTNAPVAVANSDTDIVALKVATTTTTVIVTAAGNFTASSKVHVVVRGWE